MRNTLTAALAIIAAFTMAASSAGASAPPEPRPWQARTVPHSAPRPHPAHKLVPCRIRVNSPFIENTYAATPNNRAVAGHWYGKRLDCVAGYSSGPPKRCLGVSDPARPLDAGNTIC